MRPLVLLLLLSASAAHAQPPESNARDWLAIGDALAASADAGSLERALAAYAHVLPQPAHSDYALALHHTAWILFLLDRAPESIARFAELVDFLDAHGGAHPELRAEAIDLLGAMFADPDWDRDGSPDVDGTLARLTSPALIAQDRPWLAELYFETGHALYLSLRDPAAISLLDHSLTRWPAPAAGTAMDAACRRHRARQQAMDASAPPQPEADALCARYAPE